ncbi:MAG: hypothetical protein ACAI43_12870, partial [Phycisphaerae bacterium]
MPTRTSAVIRAAESVVESLESRTLLAANLIGDRLIVDGTRRSDSIAINTRDGGITLRVFVNGVRENFFAADVGVIEIYGYRGNDRIEMA